MAVAPNHGQTRRKPQAIALGGHVASAVRRPSALGAALERWGAMARAAWMAEVDRRRLFLWLPVFYGLGIIAYFSAESEPSLLASGIPLGLAGIGAILARQRLATLLPALALAALAAGFFVATWRTQRVAAPVLVAPMFATLTGTVEAIERTHYGVRLVLTVSHMEPAVGDALQRVRLTFRGRMVLESGQRVSLKARLTPPSPPAVPGGFDFQREAYFQRLGAVGMVSGPITALPAAESVSLALRIAAGIDHARNVLTTRIISVIGGSTGAIAAALVTGKRGEIAESDNEAWRGAGIYHIISISGLHMMLAAGLFFWSARLVLTLLPGFSRQHATKKWAAVVAMIGATAYDIFSGNDVATERSLIMTLVMLGAILVDRPALAMRNLAISGLVVMTLRPETILGPSFQMSFSAVAGLVAYGEFMRRRREAAPLEKQVLADGALWRGGRLAMDFTATSLIAGLATGAFQAFHFHRLNPYGLLGNAIAVPVCSIVVMPAALAGVVLYPLGLDAPAWSIMGYGISFISLVAGWVSALAGAVATVARFSGWSLAWMALGIAFITLMTTRMFHTLALGVLALGGLLAARSPHPVMIMHPEGTSALVRTDGGGLTFLGKSRPAFALQQWLPGERDARSPRDPTLVVGARCDALGCTALLPDGRPVALVLDAQAFAEDCERAQVIITPLKVPDHCRATVTAYDRGHFRRHGATYAYSQGEAFTNETARNGRETRPWIPQDRAREDRARGTPTTPASPATSTLPGKMPPAWDPQAPDFDGDAQ